MFFGRIKKYSLYIVFSFFLTSNAFLVGQAFPFKKTLVILLLIVTVVSSFFQKEEFKKVIYYFIYFNNDKTIKKISGGVSLLAWVSFTSSLFFLNVDSLWLARGFFLLFIASVIVSGVFIFYDLERGGHVIFNKLKFLFFSGIPVLYFVTSAYAASYFCSLAIWTLVTHPCLS